MECEMHFNDFKEGCDYIVISKTYDAHKIICNRYEYCTKTNVECKESYCPLINKVIKA